jgi:hypothetical protein
MSAQNAVTAPAVPEATWHRAIPVFAAAFAVVYVLAVENNWALVTYHPKIGEWDWLTRPSRNGPAMHWFGWLGTATLAAAGISAASLALPKQLVMPPWIGWCVPLAVMALFVYLLRGFFLAELR